MSGYSFPFLTKSMVFCMAVMSLPIAEAGTITYGGSGTLSANGSWVGGARPVTTDEALFTGTLPALISTASGTNLEFGDLILDTNSTTVVGLNTTSTSGTTTQIRFSGGGGSTAAVAAGGASGDLLVMGTNAVNNTLRFVPNAGTGTNALQMRLITDGNFNVVNSGAVLDIQVRITDNNEGHSITKTGAGTMILAGTNTIGGVTAASGTVLVNGTTVMSASSAVTVASLATLGGAGTITGPVNVSAGGKVEPGNSPSVVGTLATGILTMNGNYLATITGNGVNDRLNITGDGNFSGTISPVLSSYVPALDDVFNLADWTGSFIGAPVFDFGAAPLGAGLEWDSSSFSTDGTLRVVAVPEPGAAGLLAGLTLTLGLRRQRSGRGVPRF